MLLVPSPVVGSSGAIQPAICCIKTRTTSNVVPQDKQLKKLPSPTTFRESQPQPPPHNISSAPPELKHHGTAVSHKRKQKNLGHKLQHLTRIDVQLFITRRAMRTATRAASISSKRKFLLTVISCINVIEFHETHPRSKESQNIPSHEYTNINFTV